MNLFKKAFGDSKRNRTRGYKHSDPAEMFKEIMTTMATLMITASPREARRALVEQHGLSKMTAQNRFKQAMEVQKWLNEEHLIFRYNNDD